jgi:hypothetical protein
VTWVQRHVEEEPPGRLWAVVLAGECPWPECPFAADVAHAHHLREDGTAGIVTDNLRAIGAGSR